MVKNIELNHVKQKLNNIKRDKILLAISGGVDSVFLLDLLLSCDIKPILFFINYNPNGNSNSREKKIILWLNHIKKDAQEVFLMGDLFDFWFEYKHVIPKNNLRFLFLSLLEFFLAGIIVKYLCIIFI